MSQIIKQPNGLYCKYSSISDTIEIWNATREELIEDAVKYYREVVTRGIDEVLAKLDQENGRPYYQFTKTFEEALEETKGRAKLEHYQRILKDLDLPVVHECLGCGNEIDPDVCHCGITKENHTAWEGHTFVPAGCDCGRAKSNDIPEEVMREAGKIVAQINDNVVTAAREIIRKKMKQVEEQED
jgi:hypothetical protein